MNKKEISGNIFIIPNMLFKPSSEGEWNLDFFKKFTKGKIEKIVGREVSEDEVYVQVWVFTPGEKNSNWSDHSWPGEEIVGFPNYLPYKELENLKEGETITLESENFTIKLTADQLGARYRLDGRFENALKVRKEVFDAWEGGETIYIGGFPCKKGE